MAIDNVNGGYTFGNLGHLFNNLTELSVSCIIKPHSSYSYVNWDNMILHVSGLNGFYLRILWDTFFFWVGDGTNQYSNRTQSVVTNGEETRFVFRFRASPETIDIFRNSTAKVPIYNHQNGNPVDTGVSTGSLLLCYFPPVDGAFSEVAVWNYFLPDRVCAALSYGKMSAEHFRDYNGLFYAPFVNPANVINLWGKEVGHKVNTVYPPYAPHPKMIHPVRTIIGKAPDTETGPGAGPGESIGMLAGITQAGSDLENKPSLLLGL